MTASITWITPFEAAISGPEMTAPFTFGPPSSVIVTSPPWAVAANLLFATAFNLPCLWLQRYNRLRLVALLARLEP